MCLCGSSAESSERVLGVLRQLPPSLLLLSSCRTAFQRSPTAKTQKGHGQLLWHCVGLAPLPSPLLLCQRISTVPAFGLSLQGEWFTSFPKSPTVWFSFRLVSTCTTSPIMADSNSRQKLLCPFCSQTAELFLPLHYIADLTSPVTFPGGCRTEQVPISSSTPYIQAVLHPLPSCLHTKPQSRARLGFVLSIGVSWESFFARRCRSGCRMPPLKPFTSVRW